MTAGGAPSALHDAALHDAARDGVLAALDVHFAELLVRRGAVPDGPAALAAALAAKAVRLEHVCAVLDDDGVDVLWRDAAGEPAASPPDAAAMLAALRAAPGAVEEVDDGADCDESDERPLVVSGSRCYLRRYALLEQLVARRLRDGRDLGVPVGADGALDGPSALADDDQRAAVRRALAAPVSVVAGGPGTGKTTAVGLLLAAAEAARPPLAVALAAPTGKAAARLDEAVLAADGGGPAPRATTLHRLLRIGPDGVVRLREPLDADVVVVDEASMVSLPLLAETLRRSRPDARVVLVGDPDQLASIEVGAVLSDVVAAAADATSGVVVSTLSTAHRFGDAAGVAALADAVRAGSAEAVARAVAAHDTLSLGEPSSSRERVVDDVVAWAESLVEAARRGDAQGALARLSAVGVLCANRLGDGSADWWRRRIERRLAERGVLRPRDGASVGRPLLVTRNDPLTGLSNGMTGVVVAHPDGPRAAFASATLPLQAVAWAETAWALTIHKAQGSEYDEVVVSLPTATSALLTRELVYTAVTRARRAVTLLAPPGSLDAALSRRVARASGLVARLSAHGTP